MEVGNQSENRLEPVVRNICLSRRGTKQLWESILICSFR